MDKKTDTQLELGLSDSSAKLYSKVVTAGNSTTKPETTMTYDFQNIRRHKHFENVMKNLAAKGLLRSG